MKFDKILITTDFSEDSKKVFDLSAYEAKMEGSEITLLHVFDEYFIPPTLMSELGNPVRALTDARNAAKKQLEELANEHLHDLNVKTELLSTRDGVAGEICKYADENNFDLIIIASHGLSGLPKLFLGSVAQKVIVKSSCPVLVIPKDKDE